MVLLDEGGVPLRSAADEGVELRGLTLLGCEGRGCVRSLLRGDVCGEAEGLRCPCEVGAGAAPARPLLGARCAKRDGANANRTRIAMRE